MAPPVALETPNAGSIQPKTPKSQDNPAPNQAGNLLFNPAKHLSFSPPSRTLQMSDLALSPTALSSVATTEPFPLLSHDAVLAHRREIFSPDVLDNCMHHTRPGSVQIRGMAPRYAPFIHQFWHSPEVLKIISDVAGVELVPAMDYEISHANVQLGAGGLEEVRGTPVDPPVATEEAIANFRREKEKEKEKKKETVREAVATDQTKPIIEWHKDSHPFVCVVMLSDARHMAGGETELMKGDGGTLKVKAPQIVSYTKVIRVYRKFANFILLGLCCLATRSIHHAYCSASN